MSFTQGLGDSCPYATRWHPRMRTALVQAPKVGAPLRCTGVPLQWHPTGWHIEPDIGSHRDFPSLAIRQASRSRWLVSHILLLKAWLQPLPTPAETAGVHSSL